MTLICNYMLIYQKMVYIITTYKKQIIFFSILIMDLHYSLFKYV